MSEAKKSSSAKVSIHLMNIKHPERVGKRLKLAFQRTDATVVLSGLDRTVDSGLSMIDLSEIGASVFTATLLSKGSAVELKVDHPLPMHLKCLVAWSIPVQSGVQSRRFAFRSGLQFIFENDAQKASLQEYLQKVNTDPMENLRNVAAQKTAAEASAAAALAPAVDAASPEGTVNPETVPAALEGASVTPISEAAPAPEASAEAAAETAPEVPASEEPQAA